MLNIVVPVSNDLVCHEYLRSSFHSRADQDRQSVERAYPPDLPPAGRARLLGADTDPRSGAGNIVIIR